MLGAPEILVNVTKDTARANGFRPLTLLLGTALVDHEVRPVSPARHPRLYNPSLQEFPAIRNKIEVLLPHVTSLDNLFVMNPGSVADRRCRVDLIRYVALLSLASGLTSSQ